MIKESNREEIEAFIKEQLQEYTNNPVLNEINKFNEMALANNNDDVTENDIAIHINNLIKYETLLSQLGASVKVLSASSKEYLVLYQTIKEDHLCAKKCIIEFINIFITNNGDESLLIDNKFHLKN